MRVSLFSSNTSSTICGEESRERFNNSTPASNVIDIEFADDVLRIREIAFKYVSPVVIAVGILGNMLNLFVLSKPFLKGPTKIYLTALAISDLGVMLATIPLLVRLNRMHGQNYYAAFFHAHVEIFLTNVFIATSVFIVVCVTVDRYLSLCYPKMFRNVHKKKTARGAILLAAAVGVVVSVPLVALKNACLMKSADEGLYWDFHENLRVTGTVYWSVYLIAEGFLTRFGPAVLLAVLNVFIIRKFRKLTARRQKLLASTSFVVQDRKFSRNNASIRNRKYYEEKRLVVILRAIVGLFFVTMTPAAILSFLYAEEQEAHFGFQTFRAVANNLEIANFALNFYVYCLCSKDFREALVKVFEGCGKVGRYRIGKDEKGLEDVIGMEIRKQHSGG